METDKLMEKNFKKEFPGLGFHQVALLVAHILFLLLHFKCMFTFVMFYSFVCHLHHGALYIKGCPAKIRASSVFARTQHHSVTTVALNRYIIIDTTLIGQQTERISILEYAIPTSAAPSPQNVMVLARVRGDFRKVGNTCMDVFRLKTHSGLM